MNTIKDLIKQIIPVLTVNHGTGIPTFTFELDKRIELDNKEIEDRIIQLDEVKNKLITAAHAIRHISQESKQKKIELESLHQKLEALKKDKDTTEKLLGVDQESFTRLLIAMNKKTEKRSIWMGIIIGFITGTLSSFTVYWLTS